MEHAESDTIDTSYGLIDTHCHLEQPDYEEDLEDVIKKCKKSMKAVITCAANPKHYNLAFDLVKKHPNFVFATASVHPEYVKRFTDDEIEKAIKHIKSNRESIVGIGETGLDYSYIIGEEWREKQRDLFARFLRLARSMGMPAVVHIRAGKDRKEVDVFEHAFDILEREKARRVQLHMFGARRLVQRAIDNEWYISMNAICLRSKSYSKVVRDTPIGRLMLETDAPWLHPSFDKEKRNDPSYVKDVAERVAKIKKIPIEKVVETTTRNAKEFFNLNI